MLLKRTVKYSYSVIKDEISFTNSFVAVQPLPYLGHHQETISERREGVSQALDLLGM